MAEAAITPVAEELPDKLYFRIGEVSRLTGVKAYVLRFWETEFPGLGPRKTGSGHRLYRRKDVELVLEIKHLLYEKRFTIEGARKWLESHRTIEPAPAPSLDSDGNSAHVQGVLFPVPGPWLDELRKELRDILKILK
ncbi:MAG TPA: MerR family transcriptional regulator [Bryobacteraceae bacterium]|jgi:DNA-binding transcriptional MerR regulator